jgi:hypothetical protein
MYEKVLNKKIYLNISCENALKHVLEADFLLQKFLTPLYLV